MTIQSSSQIWNTAFTQVFQCRLPIIQAPMAGVAGGQLASEVTRAGGRGMIASGHFDDGDKLEREIDLYVESTMDSPSIGFIGFSSLSTRSKWKNYEHILNKYKPKAEQFFAPSIVEQEGGKSNVQLAHDYGVKFIAQVGTIKEAKQVIEHNVDAIICQGNEAGGHGIHRNLGNSTIALASQISNMVDKSIPIIAAGGIVSGKQLASALCVCDGVSIGTRYWASNESLGNAKLQQELIKSNSCDDVVRTTVFDTIQNSVRISGHILLAQLGHCRMRLRRSGMGDKTICNMQLTIQSY